MLAEWPAEHVPGTPPLAFCVRHDACLLVNSKIKFGHQWEIVTSLNTFFHMCTHI